MGDNKFWKASKIAIHMYSPYVREFCSKWKVNPDLVYSLIFTYARITDSGVFSSNTVWKMKGWVSDDITPDKCRYGLTQIKLSKALLYRSNYPIAITRVYLFNPSNAIDMTARIVSAYPTGDLKKVINLWHDGVVPFSLEKRFLRSYDWCTKNN